MFNKTALANSLAWVGGITYVVFYIIMLLFPRFFVFVFNAQFLGADVAGLVPSTFTFGDFIWTLIAIIVTGWLVGYLWGWLYNRLAK
ncbi:hypothetical protein COB64_02155 [Candidatus Wolfebacteria bacterium]|nr:MAG: hypothetical protein COB64_02155 [Candidatus Wolfebacteria bacterium]